MRIRIFIALMVAAIMLPLVLASAFAVNQIRLEERWERHTALANIKRLEV